MGVGEVAADVEVELLVSVVDVGLAVVGPSSGMEVTSVVGEKDTQLVMEAQSADEVLVRDGLVCGLEELLPL